MAEELEVKKSKIYGRGCFTRKRFPARKMVALFAGELIKGRRRIQARLNDQDIVKIISLNDDTAIDGAVGGNATAYINHSCAPNVFMRNLPGDRVGFFALRDINPGEEITMDYRDPDHPEVCRCGAPNCRSNKKRKRQSATKKS